MVSLVSLLLAGGLALLQAEPDDETKGDSRLEPEVVEVTEDKLPSYARWVPGPPILPLPEWTEVDLAQIEAGPVLLGENLGIFPLDSDAETSRFSVIQGLSVGDTPGEGSGGVEFLDESQRDLYWTVRPLALADPFEQVPLARLENLSRMLRENAEPVGTAVHVMVLCRNQRFPMNTGWRERMEAWFGQDESAVLIVYPIGLADEVDLIYSKRLSEALPLTRRLEIADSAVESALQVKGGVDQLEAYLLEICNGYYRYREMIQLPKSALPPVLTHEQPPEVKVARTPEFFSLWQKARVGHALLGLLAIVSSAVIAVAAWQAHQKNLNRQYVFPNRRIFPRFGGTCSGGAGSAVRFDNRRSES